MARATVGRRPEVVINSSLNSAIKQPCLAHRFFTVCVSVQQTPQRTVTTGIQRSARDDDKLRRQTDNHAAFGEPIPLAAAYFFAPP